jgi:yersiniabactin synthetase, thioesterase component
MLRSDFRVAETYRRQLTEYRPKVGTQTLLLWGSEDREATREDVEGWMQWLAGEKHLTRIAGDHFQLIREPKDFLEPILHHFPAIFSRKAPW